MSRRGTLLAALLVTAGCAPPLAERIEQALGTSRRLVLLLGGGPVASGGSDDATASVSAEGGTPAYPPYVASVAAPKVPAAAATAALLDRVRGYYLPFDLEVLSARPSSGDYAAIFVGGRAEALAPAPPSGIAGLAALDCGDANPRSLGFAFSDSLAPQFGGLPALAAAIAHEAGHGYGLQHTTTTRDPMYSVPVPQQTLVDLFSLSFQAGAYSPFVAGGGAPQPEACGHASPIDNHALLLGALGARTMPLSLPPTLTLDFPPAQAVLPQSLPIEIAAGDDIGVVRVEIYRDLELVRVLDAPPYRTTLSLPVALSTTLTIEVVDGDAQRARLVRSFEVSASAPAACDSLTPCALGDSCQERFCASLSPPAVDAGGSDAAEPVSPPSDCSMASTRERPAPLSLVVLAGALLVRSRRSSRARG